MKSWCDEDIAKESKEEVSFVAGADGPVEAI